MNFDNPTSVYTKSVRTFLCRILFVCGLWKPFEKPKWLQNIYSTYSVVFLTIFSIIYAATMVINIFLLTDFSELSNRLFMSLTEAALAIKVINFFFNNREWQFILSELDDFRTKCARDEQILRSKVRTLSIGMYTFFYNVQFCANASGIIPLLMGAKNLLYSGWYPGFDWENNRRDYWQIYTYQYAGILITGSLNIAIDACYWFVLHILSAQFNIVGKRIESIQFDETKDSISKVRLDLIQQMEAHQRLNSILKLIQRNIQWAYFSQVLLSSIIICSMTRELAETSFSDNMAMFLTNLFYVIGFSIQIFLMCTFGQKLISEYDLLSYRLFNSNWLEILAASKWKDSKNCQKVLIIFSEVLQQEQKIMIGKVFPLSLRTFTSILNVAYRLFAVLK